MELTVFVLQMKIKVMLGNPNLLKTGLPSYEDITKLYHQGGKCDFHYIISNAKKLTKSKIYFENPRHKQILYDKFLELDEFDWENIYNFANNHKVKKKLQT